MGTIVSKENLKRKIDFSHSPNQSKRFKSPAALNNGDEKNLIPFSWQNGLSLNVSIDREGKNIHSQERLTFAEIYVCLIKVGKSSSE